MFKTLINAFRNKEVRKKIFITFALLLVYRIGCWLPVPGISSLVYDNKLDAISITGLLSAISGGALQNGAFLAIGIGPYINASIIMQLITIAIPKLEALSKQGDEGKKKITQYTRVFTLVLAVAQAIGIVISWANSGGLNTTIFGANTQTWVVASMVVVILVAGSAFTMWLGERITEAGVSNGISLLIFVGILSTAGFGIVQTITAIFGGDQFAIYQLIGFAALVVSIFALIVFVDLGERRIPIQYAKQIKGRKQYGGQSTHIPIKVNASGVLPIIFAMALITFPQLLIQIFQANDALSWYAEWLGAGTVIYNILVGLLILFFSYFYAQIQFNPEEVSRNIQQYGGFIPGIRPGKPTSDYLARISKRLTLFGAIFLAFIAIVPSVIFSAALDGSGLVNAFSATGLLIVVSVALEFDKQLESQLMMKHYKGFLK